LRWPLAGVIGLVFAAGQLIEIGLLETLRPASRLFDVVVWGLLGAVAIWLCLTWLGRQQQRLEASLERALADQQRTNRQLALLSEVNHQFAASATLDELQAAALALPQRLIPARAAALVLAEADGMVEVRAEGASPAELQRWRASLAMAAAAAADPRPRRLRPTDHRLSAAPTALATPPLTTAPIEATTTAPAAEPPPALLVPLHDGIALVGWLELYLAAEPGPTPDELALLATIASEMAETLVSARRRLREARAIFELESAIMEERARIARDIHDGLAQSLAFLRMRVDLWKDWIIDEPDHLRAELDGLKTTLREQIHELRRAIFALRPVQFDAFGFAGGLQRYIVEFAEQQGWTASVDLHGVPARLSQETEAICFRIVQEALTNVAKHAAATTVTVMIGPADNGLQLTIRDNGRGFVPGEAAPLSGEADRHRRPTDPADQPPPPTTGGLGLRQMRERLAAVRGQLTLLTSPAAGTEVRVWLPLPALNQSATDPADRGPVGSSTERGIGGAIKEER
jgi:signal transduction histidine kinase